MSDAVPCDSRAAGDVGDVLDVRGSHDPGVEDTDILEDLVEFDVLLRMGAEQVVIVQARDGEDALSVTLRVVEPVFGACAALP